MENENYLKFINAIHNKSVVLVSVDSKEKGVITRTCIPFDFGPSKRYKDGSDRFHFYDLDSPEGKHNLSILEVQLITLEILIDSFEPGDYVTWVPNWIVARDWGAHS